MGNVTKQYIRDTCLNQLIGPSEAATNVNGVTAGNSATDEQIAQGAGYPIYDQVVNGGTYWNVNWPSYAYANLYNATVSGPELAASLKELMIVCSRVRLIQFVKTQTYNKVGNKADVWSGTWVGNYFRYGYVYNGAIDGGHYRPSNYLDYFAGLNTGQTINQGTWDWILASMRNILNTNWNMHTYNISYCHYSCHSSCHYSRGRR